jgi:predicted nucleic acid-binding Zn ribbon protein
VLAQWRGIDLAPLEKVRERPARAADSLVAGVLGELRIDRRRSEAEVVRAWDQLIDPNITAHARPNGLVRGTLFVVVDSSVWLDEIVRYRRKEILDRLQSCFGRELVQRISFRAG